jgi:cytochrome d ubiquinol oxidase subunit I
MDAELLARIQFAFTVGFHFLFPPITIGMAWILVWMLGRWKKTGDDAWRRTARFWIKIFAITFAMGVATGITMEFQFGTNWADYSRYVGDIFGAPLAAEGIFAFFLESTFLGVLLFGFGRFKPRTLWFAALMVAVGSTLSAFWIIVANSWMQTPAGYTFNEALGRAELTDFWAAVFNPSTMPRYVHTVVASLVTGSFFVMGISAVFLLRRRHEPFARSSFRIALVLAAVSSFLQAGTGHWHAVQVAKTQPAKLAAVEGLFETRRGAPLLLFGVPDHDEERVAYAVEIPKALSWVAFGDGDAEVKGLEEFPKDEWPPLALTFYPFHLMVVLGFAFIGLTLLGLFLLWRKRLFDSRWYLWLAALALPLPILVNELGWITAEVGRQPWIVQGLLKTRDAISPNVDAGAIVFSLAMFGTLYLLLFLCWVYVLRRMVRKGPEEVPGPAANGDAKPVDGPAAGERTADENAAVPDEPASGEDAPEPAAGATADGSAAAPPGGAS